MSQSTCSADDVSGFSCQRPARYRDPQRGHWVCDQHAEFLIDSPDTAGRFAVQGHELTSGDPVAISLNEHWLVGRVAFDASRQRYIVWIGAAALPLRVGLRARRIAM